MSETSDTTQEPEKEDETTPADEDTENEDWLENSSDETEDKSEDKKDNKKVVQNVLTENLTSLHEHLVCTICLSVPATSVKQCSNGHITCQPCASQLERCAVCQETFCVQNSTCLNNILSTLPKFCTHKGCKEVFLPGDDHEEFCGYRQVSCKEGDCEQNVAICEFVKHYDNEHPYGHLVVEVYKRMNTSWKDFYRPTNKRDKHVLNVTLGDKMYRILGENVRDEKVLRMTVLFYPKSKDEEYCFLKIKIKKGHFEFTKTLKPLIMTGGKKEVELDLVENKTEHCLDVPNCFLPCLEDFNDLPFSYTLVK